MSLFTVDYETSSQKHKDFGEILFQEIIKQMVNCLDNNLFTLFSNVLSKCLRCKVYENYIS